jgi:integrase
MARAFNKLSATAVANRKEPGRLGDGGGLWFNVTPTGSRSWVFRWNVDKKPVEIGIGAFPALTLANARKKADAFREMIAIGQDPRIERQRLAGNSFGEVADLFLKSMASRWSNEKTAWQWQHSLTETASAIRARPVKDIETADILKILKPIWQKTPETASRARMRLEHVLDYAKAQGWRENENPARWRGHLANLLPARDPDSVKHHAAMSWKDVPAFYSQLADQHGLAAIALRFTILTASRTGETLGAQWSEIDFAAKVWSIPAERMKMSRPHEVPLPEAVIGILKPLQEAAFSKFVFPGMKPGKPLSNMAMENVLRRMKVDSATVHGFRSSFRDWAGDATAFEREIAEAALSHVVGNTVERSYRRGTALEKRRALMQAWSDFCTGTQAKNVVRLHG